MTCALPSSGTARITSRAANDRHGNATVHLRASRDIETSRDRQGELGVRSSANRLAYQSKESRGAVARGTGIHGVVPWKAAQRLCRTAIQVKMPVCWHASNLLILLEPVLGLEPRTC